MPVASDSARNPTTPGSASSARCPRSLQASASCGYEPTNSPRRALPVDTVFVVENEASYLAFPEVPNAIVVFGEGFHVTTLEELPWLHHKEIVYWGDIDTHGFAILNRLRARFASVRSILMDHETLLAHSAQCVTEPSPTAEPLPHLTAQEQSLYQDLIEDRFGTGVRLEQERIRFSELRRALELWQAAPRSGIMTPGFDLRSRDLLGFTIAHALFDERRNTTLVQHDRLRRERLGHRQVVRATLEPAIQSDLRSAAIVRSHRED